MSLLAPCFRFAGALPRLPLGLGLPFHHPAVSRWLAAALWPPYKMDVRVLGSLCVGFVLFMFWVACWSHVGLPLPELLNVLPFSYYLVYMARVWLAVGCYR